MPLNLPPCEWKKGPDPSSSRASSSTLYLADATARVSSELERRRGHDVADRSSAALQLRLHEPVHAANVVSDLDRGGLRARQRPGLALTRETRGCRAVPDETQSTHAQAASGRGASRSRRSWHQPRTDRPRRAMAARRARRSCLRLRRQLAAVARPSGVGPFLPTDLPDELSSARPSCFVTVWEQESEGVVPGQGAVDH